VAAKGLEVRLIFLVAGALALAACTSTQITRNSGAALPPARASSQVDVLLSAPDRPYDVIGLVSATKWKPGLTDPSVSDAIPQLQQAGRDVGADAVIVRSSRSNNDRHVVVEAEAIRYKD
jgi:hypothetical protein